MLFPRADEEEIMLYRRLLAVALVVGMPGLARAQFTTFIPPRAKAVDSVKAVVAAQAVARSDSIVNTQLTNIKTWVDSAAGTMSAAPTTAADTIAASTSASVTARSDTVAMRNGRRAPATASALPLIALLGLGAIAAGLLLLAGAEKPNEAHVRPDRADTRA
jgi:hypothetical protein